MSHNVEKMMFTGKKPWWYGGSIAQGEAIGVDLGEGPVTSVQAIEAAGLDWDVVKRDSGWYDPYTSSWQTVENDSYLIRDKDDSVLGRCTDEYELYQNREAFLFLDALVEQGDLLYHTAGSLEHGQRVWILAQTPTHWTIRRRSGRENTHHAFVNAMLGHNGKTSISLMATDVRIECANTLGWADSKAEDENLIFRIPHRGDIDSKLRLASSAIQQMEQMAPERRQILQEMAQSAMNTDEFIDFATSIFLGIETGDEDETTSAIAKFYEKATPRSKTMMENKVADVTELFIAGQGNEGDSMYDALEGFSEYFDHFDLGHIRNKIERNKRAAKAVTSSWLGAGAQRKSLVYKRLHEKIIR